MSQTNVERVIGLLATDEAFRRRFESEPQQTLKNLVEGGWALTPCEFHALASLDPRRLARFANGLDPRLQKSDLRGGEEAGDSDRAGGSGTKDRRERGHAI